MKKMMIGLVALVILFMCMFYFKATTVYNFMEPYNSGNLPKKINAFIYFSAYSNKELEVSGEDSIKSIISLIENIQIRKMLAPPDVYNPKFKDTYRFVLSTNNERVLNIDLLSSEYIEINRVVYKIINTPDLSEVYETIILDQSEGTLDEYYYKWIDTN